MCGEKFLKHSDEALKILGGVGLFFSFTEVTFSSSLISLIPSLHLQVLAPDSYFVRISFLFVSTDPWCLASDEISESEGSSSQPQCLSMRLWILLTSLLLSALPKLFFPLGKTWGL